MTLAAVNVDVLRQGWDDAVSALAPDLPEVSAMLGARLEQAEREGRLDEASLLAIVDDVRAATARAGGADVARLLTRRLQRAVYEYLLSLDALAPEETTPAPVVTVSHEVRGDLIGVEEVAELAGRQATRAEAAEPAGDDAPAAEAAPMEAAPPKDQPHVEAPPPGEALDGDVDAEPDVPEAAETQPEVVPEASAGDAGSESVTADPATAELGKLEAEASAEPSAVETEAAHVDEDTSESTPAADDTAKSETAEAAPPEANGDGSRDGARRLRFMIFRQPARREEAPKAPEASPAPEAVPATDTSPAPDASAAPDASPAPDGAVAPPYPVAPRDGFHLTDYPDLLPPSRPDDKGRVTILEDFEPPPAPPAPAPPTPVPDVSVPASAEPPPTQHAAEPEVPVVAAQPAPDDKGWHIRKSGRNQPGDGRNGTSEQLSDEDDSESRARFENDPVVVEARHQIGDRLRRRRCDEAASLLQKLAAEVGGRQVSELALDAGDRCRALGKANAALSCYLAASRSDPVHEPPLMRLADICLDDRDIELAVSYLERVARLRRMRDDHKGALRIYRKITTVAPYRDDILAVLMRAQATGRFEE